MLKNTKLFLPNIYENKVTTTTINNNKQQVHEYEVPTGIFLQTATFFAVEPGLGEGQLKDYRVFDALSLNNDDGSYYDSKDDDRDNDVDDSQNDDMYNNDADQDLGGRC